MPCTICDDPLFKCEATAASADGCPKALSCGHVYHGRCIELWFSASPQPNCPTCNSLHVGALLTLYINVDTGDVPVNERLSVCATSAAAENQVAGEAENQAEGQTGDAAGGTENQAEDQMEGAAGGTENQAEDQMEGAAGGTENQTASSANERRLSAQVATLMGQALDRIEQIRELNRKLEAETLHNNGLERALDNYMAMLRQKTDSIREKDGIIDSLEFEVDRLESQAAGHLGNIRGLRRKVDGLNAKIANTDALQSRADQMQSEVNRLEQLAGRHSANINGLNRKVQEQSAKIETLEADNSELNRLSVAHRTHITSLQRALDSERAIANGDDDCACENSCDDSCECDCHKCCDYDSDGDCEGVCECECHNDCGCDGDCDDDDDCECFCHLCPGCDSDTDEECDSDCECDCHDDCECDSAYSCNSYCDCFCHEDDY